MLGLAGTSGQNDWFMGEDNKGCDNSQKSNFTFSRANQIYSLYNSVTEWKITEQMIRENWPSSVTIKVSF